MTLVQAGTPDATRVTPVRRGPKPQLFAPTPGGESPLVLVPSRTFSVPSESDRLWFRMQADDIEARMYQADLMRQEMDTLERLVCSGLPYVYKSPRPAPPRTRTAPAAIRATPAQQTMKRAQQRERAYRTTLEAAKRKNSKQSGAPLTASTGDPLRDEYRHVSGAILQLRAAGHPVSQSLLMHRDRLLRQARERG